MTAMSSSRDNCRNAIRSHVLRSLDDETIRLIHAAQYDLHCGPGSAGSEDYPGFATACRRISDSMTIHDLWISEDYDIVLDSEPEWADPSDEESTGEIPDMWTRVDSRTVREIVLGELAQYL